MIVKDLLKLVNYKVKQSWASASIGNDWLSVINESLWQLFDYKWYRRLRQMTLEEIPASQWTMSINFQFDCTFPILDVHAFYTLPEEACVEWITSCQPLWESSTRLDRCNCWYVGVCGITSSMPTCAWFWVHEDWRIEMEHRKPKSTISCWQFQMLYWQWQKTLRGMLPSSLKNNYKVFVEYLRWFNIITSHDDDIQIPDNLTPALSHLIASKIVDWLWQFRSWDWSYHYSMFERIMDMAYENQPQTMKVLKMEWY